MHLVAFDQTAGIYRLGGIQAGDEHLFRHQIHQRLNHNVHRDGPPSGDSDRLGLPTIADDRPDIDLRGDHPTLSCGYLQRARGSVACNCKPRSHR